MICPQRNHHLLLILIILVLLHVHQTVNSLHNGYPHNPADAPYRYGQNPSTHRYSRKGGGGSDLGRRDHMINGVNEREREHHFRHQHNHQLHRHQQRSSSINSIRNDELHHIHHIHTRPPPHEIVHRFATRRIEEAAHAFRGSTTERTVALHGHNVQSHHKHHNQPLHNHHHIDTIHHSQRQPGYHQRVQQQTPRPQPDNNLESQKKSLVWAVNRHQGSSVSNDFTTTSPLVLETETSLSRSVHPESGGRRDDENGASLHQDHSKHSDGTDDSYDDDNYYYYEEDNDNDDNESDDDEHANEDVNADTVETQRRHIEGDDISNGLESSEPLKRIVEGLIESGDSAPYTAHDNTMDYDDEHDFLADEPVDGVGSFTEQKWRNYSTREGVEKMARAESPSIAADAHIRRINQEGLCQYPHPKVVPISNNTSKRFIPYSTILHRCGDDTACCWSNTKTCVAKTTASVVLYFYVILMDQTTIIEPLSLINHTECHCIDRKQVRSSKTSSFFDMTPSPERQIDRCVKYFDLDESDKDYIRCDCINQNGEIRETCERLSRGEEGFLLEDQRCISQGRCKPPTCEYGQYNKTIGRCPNKDQKIEIAKLANQRFL